MLFVKLFKKYSPSELHLPKLHNWCYHIISTIKEYGAINGFTTETYESLHPYKKRSYRKHTENIRKHTKNIQKMCAIRKLYRNCTENI